MEHVIKDVVADALYPALIKREVVADALCFALLEPDLEKRPGDADTVRRELTRLAKRHGGGARATARLIRAVPLATQAAPREQPQAPDEVPTRIGASPAAKRKEPVTRRHLRKKPPEPTPRRPVRPRVKVMVWALLAAAGVSLTSGAFLGGPLAWVDWLHTRLLGLQDQGEAAPPTTEEGPVELPLEGSQAPR